jgi:F0F1-type ATP synthase delta subunit
MRELTALSDFFISSQARTPGTNVQPPRLSRSLDQLAQTNKINLLEDTQRRQLYKELNEVLGRAPLIHMSFASEASPKALDKVVAWLRSNIHPQTLLQVGLQPTIAAGCIVRTTNRVFDLSLRTHLREQEPYLTQLIATAAASKA